MKTRRIAGNRALAARLLRTTRRIFNYKVRNYGIDWERFARELIQAGELGFTLELDDRTELDLVDEPHADAVLLEMRHRVREHRAGAFNRGGELHAPTCAGLRVGGGRGDKRMGDGAERHER